MTEVSNMTEVIANALNIQKKLGKTICKTCREAAERNKKREKLQQHMKTHM